MVEYSSSLPSQELGINSTPRLNILLLDVKLTLVALFLIISFQGLLLKLVHMWICSVEVLLEGLEIVK